MVHEDTPVNRQLLNTHCMQCTVPGTNKTKWEVTFPTGTLWSMEGKEERVVGAEVSLKFKKSRRLRVSSCLGRDRKKIKGVIKWGQCKWQDDS